MRWHSPGGRRWVDRGAWLACLRDHRVIAVDAVAICVVARTATRFSIYRPEGGAMLAWKLDEVL